MPTAPTNSIAILDGEGKITTFVRSDVPAGWTPPAGHTAVLSSELPENWEHAPTPAEPVPSEVTQRQMRLWLLSVGITDAQIRAVIEANPDATARAAALIEYDYASVYQRSHPLVSQIGTTLDMTSDEVDEAFRVASRL